MGESGRAGAFETRMGMHDTPRFGAAAAVLAQGRMTAFSERK
jgi:hypothetical protein